MEADFAASSPVFVAASDSIFTYLSGIFFGHDENPCHLTLSFLVIGSID